MPKLAGKVAIVTGGTSGMGQAIATRFAAEGASVVFGGRNRERGRLVTEAIRARDGKGLFVEGDVGCLDTNQKLVERAISSFGRLDILAANAGILGLGSITGVALETWHETIATNLNGVFYLLRAGIPEIQKAGGGTIVVTGSIAAYKGFPNHAAYCASKGALIPLVKQVAAEYSPEIRANIICPGPVDTPLIWDSAQAFPKPEEAVNAVADRTLMKRLGRPEDVANTALFLASEDSSWLTGAAVTLDGGVMCT
jgi:NAD(P)-dependent dehydrogenase (short-subunit alcohol dehydrogenase family)